MVRFAYELSPIIDWDDAYVAHLNHAADAAAADLRQRQSAEGSERHMADIRERLRAQLTEALRARGLDSTAPGPR